MTKEAKIVAVAAEVRRVANLLGLPPGTAPSLKQYRKHGRIPPSRVIRALSGGFLGEKGHGWATVLQKYLGLRPYPESRRPSARDVIDDLVRVAFKVGRNCMPSAVEYEQHGRYARSTVVRALLPPGTPRSWKNVAIAAGLTHKSKWLRSHGRENNRRTLIRMYRELAEKLGYTPGGPGPTRKEWRRMRPQNAPDIPTNFGSFTALVEAAGFVRRASARTRSKEAA